MGKIMMPFVLFLLSILNTAAQFTNEKFFFVIEEKGIFSYTDSKLKIIFPFDSSYSHYIHNSIKQINDSIIEFTFLVNDKESTKYCFNHKTTIRQNIKNNSYFIVKKVETCRLKDPKILEDRKIIFKENGEKFLSDSSYEEIYSTNPTRHINKFFTVDEISINYYQQVFFDKNVFFTKSNNVYLYNSLDTILLIHHKYEFWRNGIRILGHEPKYDFLYIVKSYNTGILGLKLKKKII